MAHNGLDIDVSDKREQRKFGLLMAVVIAGIGAIRWALAGHATMPFFVVAGVFLVLDLIAPPALKPIFWAWMQLAKALNWVMTRVLLSLVFYLVITPVRIWIRLFGEDPLKRRWNHEARTYWEDAEEHPEEVERYFNQF